MSSERRRTTWRDIPSRIFRPEPAGKDLETTLLRGFLHAIGVSGYSAQARERPDFSVDFLLEGQAVRCGCELTLFNSDIADRGAPGSPERRFFAQWKSFAARLQEDLARSSDRLALIYGAVFFREERMDIFDTCDEAALRGEIVELLQTWAGESTITTFDPTRFPILARFVEHVYLEEASVSDGPLWWCAHLQTGDIPDPADVLVKIIKRKSAAAATYDWGEVTKKWLVVCARSLGLADSGFITRKPAIDLPRSSIPYTEIFYWEHAFGSVHEVYPRFRHWGTLTGLPAMFAHGLPAPEKILAKTVRQNGDVRVENLKGAIMALIRVAKKTTVERLESMFVAPVEDIAAALFQLRSEGKIVWAGSKSSISRCELIEVLNTPANPEDGGDTVEK